MSAKEPQSKEEIMEFLRTKLEMGSAAPGLYDLGLGFVLMERTDVGASFQWFDEAINFNELLQQ